MAGHGGQRDQVVDAGDAPARSSLDQVVEQIDGGPRVVERSVVWLVGETKAPGQLAELEGRGLVHQEAAGKGEGVEALVAEEGTSMPTNGGLQEAHVETNVVADDDGPAHELEKGGKHRTNLGGSGHGLVGDSCQHRDRGRNGLPGVDHGLERADDLTAPHLHGADLGDGTCRRVAPGRLEVEDAERGLGQRHAELVEGALPN